MLCALIVILVQSASANSQPQSKPASSPVPLPDPYSWSEDQRVGLIRQATRLGAGSVAIDHYRDAVATFVAADDPKHARDLGPELSEALGSPVGTLALNRLPQLTDRASSWVRLNQPALRALRNATDCVRAWDTDRPISPEEATEGPPPNEDDRLLTLLGTAIAEASRTKSWNSAYDDVVRMFRFARHARQTQGKESSLEELAWNLGYDHFRLLLASHTPDRSAEVEARLRDAWNLPVPSPADQTFLYQMTVATLIDDDFAGAARTDGGGATFSKLMIEIPALAGHKTPPFKTADEYLQALLRSSRDATYEAHRRLVEIQTNWERKPIDEAMREYTRVHEQLREISERNPHTRLWFSARVANLLRPRVLDDIRLTQRRAIVTLLSVHRWRAEKREWPESLDVLSLGEDAIDPYSGRAFVYRRGADGNSFVLYSVGFDLRDGGGEKNCHLTSLGKDDSGDLLLWPPSDLDR